MGKVELDTKSLILDAAEEVFSKAGFQAASLRQIVGVAGVNLAAVNYHFGSKEGLITAVFNRRLGPINEERLGWLDQLEAGATPPSVEGVLEALVAPVVRRATAPGGEVVMRLFGRLMAEPVEFVQQVVVRQFGEVIQRFVEVLGRILPGIPHPVVLWRLEFCVGAMGRALCDVAHLRERSDGACDPGNPDTVLKQIIPFLSAGFRAPNPV